MKSFDARLQNDLFPKKPAVFDRMVRRQLNTVCGESEEQQSTVVRFPAARSEQKPVKKKTLYRIGIASAAAVLVVSTIAAGTLALLTGKGKPTPAASVSEQPTATAEADPLHTVYADTVDELLAAIASDTTIVLSDGVYNLTSASDYGIDGGNKHVWREVEDGYELVLCNLRNFRLIGSENTVIETAPRHAGVLEAEYCTGLVLKDLTIGHTKKPEKCSGEVISLTGCTDMRIESCELYGCGSWGITAWYGGNLTVADSEIFECSSGALHIWECAGVEVSGSTIRSCGGGGTLADLIYIQDSDVSLLNCDIYENTTEGSLVYVGSDGTAEHRITLIGTDMHDNRVTDRNMFVLNYLNTKASPDESTRMIVDGCAFRSNGGKLLPDGSRVYDRSGNELGEAELAAMTLKRGGSEPTAKPGGTDACGTFAAQFATPSPTPEPTAQPKVQAVHVSDVGGFLAAIAPNTEIVLAAGTYDLHAAADAYAGDNPYVSFVQNEYRVDSSERFLKITGVDGLRILVAEDAECRLAAKGCETVLFAEFCSGLTVSGLTFRGDENGIEFTDCSDVRVDRCSFEASTPVLAQRCEGVVLTNLNLSGVASAAYFDQCKDVRVREIDISDCGTAFTMDDCTDVLVSGCSIHDCRNEDPKPGEEQGDASYLIQISGQSDNVLSATFENCEIYNNKATFFFSSDGVDVVKLSGLEIRDNGFERLFDFDAAADLAGSHEIVNCDVDRNKIGTFLFCGLSETKIRLFGASVVDDEITDLFLGGDVTVSGCAFLSPAITHWIGSDESYDELRTFVHDADGNALGEAELAAMELKRDNP